MSFIILISMKYFNIMNISLMQIEIIICDSYDNPTISKYEVVNNS